MNEKTNQDGVSERLGPRARGWIAMLVLALVLAATFGMLFPNRVTPASAPAGVFSGERAMAHLPVIASQPHPQGSPAQAQVRDYLVQQLTGFGLQAEVQSVNRLENVVARLPGSDPTGAIVILAHYDSTPHGPGAGDNGSGVAALLEIMRALTSGPALRNDVIALFDDGEEYPDIFAGSRAFVRQHPLMSDVRVAISIDTAVAGPISTNEVGPEDNGRLVQALARSYTGGAWTSFSGGGTYDSAPFSQAGILVLALESNYPFYQQHTAEDVLALVRPASVQQMGEQTLAITRDLSGLDLVELEGEQETWFPLPMLALVHYPQAWSLPLAVGAAILFALAVGLALRRRWASWRGLGAALGIILGLTALAGGGVAALKPLLPDLFGWQTTAWPEWPEVIPPNGWLAAGGLGLLVLGLTTAGYLLGRRWSTREDFSLAGLLPFSILAAGLAAAEPRTAYVFLWPVLIGSLGWIAAAALARIPWRQDLAALLAALPLAALLAPFLPGMIMSDGMKSLEILAVILVLILGVSLPALDNLLARPVLSGRR